MNILDLPEDQLRALMDEGMNLPHLPPEITGLVDNMLELALRLREVRNLAVEHATRGTKIPADTLIRLLDGNRR